MNLDNFNNNVDNNILKKGEELYIKNNIQEIYKGRNHYAMRVDSEESFIVDLEISDEGEILYTHCDCSNNISVTCEHAVAVYFKLRGLIDKKIVAKSNLDIKSIDFEKVLSERTKEELVNIIKEITINNKYIKNEIIYKYSVISEDIELNKVKEQLEVIIRKYSGRGGFIEHKSIDLLANEIEELLDRAMDIFYDEDEVIIPLDIILYIIENLVRLSDYMDDPGKTLFDVINKAILSIDEIIVESYDLSDIEKEKIFNKFSEEVDKDIYKLWIEWQLEILNQSMHFADSEKLRIELKYKLNKLLRDLDDSDVELRAKDKIITMLFTLVKAYENKEDEIRFIEEHIEYRDFREMLIKVAKKNKDYKKVIELCEVGEEKAENKKELLYKWKVEKYKAYKNANMEEEQIKLGIELLLLSDDIKYYFDIKKIYLEKNEDFYEKLKAVLKNNKNIYENKVYINIIFEEKDYDELIKYIEGHLSEIERFATKIVDKRFNDVKKLYEKYIFELVEKASCRKEYKRLCMVIRDYSEIVGENLTEKLIKQLIEDNKKRPALLDELKNLI
ncbi:MAG: SWIM zinc finger family protein [Sarcina sp.]